MAGGKSIFSTQKQWNSGESTGFKSGMIAVFPGHLAAPTCSRGIVMWIPVTTIRKTPLFLRGGDARHKKMSGDTTGILQNREKASARKGPRLQGKNPLFLREQGAGKMEVLLTVFAP